MIDQNNQNNQQYQDLWNQMNSVSGQLSALNNQFTSGNVMTPGDDGFMTVGGGLNRYGEARPGTVLMRDAAGNLDPRFMQTMSPEYLALQQKAMTEGDTEAARLAREQQGIMQQTGQDQLQKQAGSALAGGMQNLAMRGGAGVGSRERLNRGISRDVMSGSQALGKEGRLANLAISQQDEQMKNQMLGQVGQVGQKIQEGNINRLQQDIRDQNIAAQSMYSEDMQAYAAQQSANAQAAASCFTGDTLFMMEDGFFRKIADIKLGERLMEGGMVFFCSQSLSDDMYIYDNNEMVSGSHAVNEKGSWIRVKDSKKSKRVPGQFIVFNLGCENHKMLTDNNVFSDFFETDQYEKLTDIESLEALNA